LPQEELFAKKKLKFAQNSPAELGWALGNMRQLIRERRSMIILQRPGEEGGGFGVGLPGGEGVLEAGEVLEDGEEAGAVGLGLVGGGQEQAEDGGAAEDERLATPPFPKTGEGLGVVRLALLVGFLREAGDGELGFDEGEGHAGKAEIGKAES